MDPAEVVAGGELRSKIDSLLLLQLARSKPRQTRCRAARALVSKSNQLRALHHSAKYAQLLSQALSKELLAELASWLADECGGATEGERDSQGQEDEIQSLKDLRCDVLKLFETLCQVF